MGRERFKLSVAVFVVVRRSAEIVMLLRQNTGWMDGYWSLPAGGLDGGETADAAAARELLEEAGIKISPQRLSLGHVQHNKTHGDEWIGLYFVADDPGQEPRLAEPEKHGAVRWQSDSDIPSATIPYVRLALDSIRQGVAYSTYSDSN